MLSIYWVLSWRSYSRCVVGLGPRFASANVLQISWCTLHNINSCLSSRLYPPGPPRPCHCSQLSLFPSSCILNIVQCTFYYPPSGFLSFAAQTVAPEGSSATPLQTQWCLKAVEDRGHNVHHQLPLCCVLWYQLSLQLAAAWLLTDAVLTLNGRFLLENFQWQFYCVAAELVRAADTTEPH